ncbi:MAG: hypothetical protein P9X24_07265 [Candidatus Hatepunaea meridiana]|nr:hypothetical protein [Candidatus Hatepunaea meridiana]
MKNPFLISLALLFFGFSEISKAQEAQIPVDEEGKIEYIDSELEQKLGLFTDYTNFREARLFQVSDTLFVLEIYYQSQGRLLKARLPFSKVDVRNFQRKVTEQTKQKEPRVILDQEGRTKLIIGSLALSLGYYGWAVPMSLEVDNGKIIVALYMLTSGAGFYIPLSATRNITVTDAAATLSLYGGTRGIAHGISLAWLLSSKPSAQGIVATGTLVSIAETIIGYNIAGKSNMSNGTAETISVGGDFGIGLGLGTAELANLLDDRKQAAAGSVLLGSGVGMWGGKWLADRQHYTRGDAYVLSAAGLLGAYIPIAVIDIVEPKDDKIYTAASMLGAFVGLSMGNKLVQGKDFTTGQGSLIRLSELAGGLLGAGFAYLVSSDDKDNSALYLSSSAIGATTGFWLMYRSYSQSAQTSPKDFLWNFRIVPEGLLVHAMNNRISSDLRTPFPLLKLDIRF